MSLHDSILEGVDSVKSRADGSVHTIHGRDGVSTLAEICVGKKTTRLNFKAAPGKIEDKDAKELAKSLGGRSKSWAGGGIVVTEENAPTARKLLAAVIAASPEAAQPEAAPEAEAATA